MSQNKFDGRLPSSLIALSDEAKNIVKNEILQLL
jgi:hypothetical protein